MEYSVKYNSLGQEVLSSWYFRAYGNLNSKPRYESYAGVNPYQRGNWRPIYYQMYNHYVNRKGGQMPCVDQMIANTEGTYIEGGAGNSLDELGWYSLTYANVGERVEDTPIQGELSDGVYRIVSALSKKSVVVNDEGNLASAEKGTRKDEWWLVRNIGDGEYTITNMSTGKAIQVNDEGTEVRNVAGEDYTYSKYYLEGTAIGTGEADGSRSQRFAFLKDDDGLFRIVPSRTYFAWGLSGDSIDDNAAIIQWFNDGVGAYDNSSKASQRWTFEKATEVGTEFTFDDKSTGFSTTYAEADGDCTLENHGDGKAVYLDGTSEFLTITSKTGKSVLAGEKAFTVSCEVKPEAGSGNWIFYAAPEGAQAAGKETYLGIHEENGAITAECYKDGSKSASVSAEGRDGWYHVSVVYNGAELILYINGQEAGRETGSHTVSEILGDDSILQIGKADIGSGEYYKGLIDNLKITGHAMTKGEIISGASDYASGEIAVPKTLVDFTFDDADTGFTGGVAAAKGVYSLSGHGDGKALYLNGYKDYLEIVGTDGDSVLPGGIVKEMTVSLQAKRDGGDYGWVFYAAPDDNTQTFQWEQYLGVVDGNGTVTAQRYLNQGERLPAAETSAQSDRWHYLTIVYTEDEIIIYENGEVKTRADNSTPLSQILGSDSIWYIGKANWTKGTGEKGEHFRGWIDNYKVESYAWTAAEVKEEALKYIDKSILKEALDNQRAEGQEKYIAGRFETYQDALETANEVIEDSAALQSAVDSAADALLDVQAWMRLDEALYDSVSEENEAEYTQKTWKPYGEALEKAKGFQEEGTAGRNEVLAAAETLRETQEALIDKGGTIAEAMKRIDAIGDVQLTPDCSRKAILARQICDILSEEELTEVANLSLLTAAETAMADYLAEFTFDDEETGFIGGQAVAEGQASYDVQNGALYLDGTGSDSLNVTKADGSSLLTGRTELTISFAAKPEAGGSNWLFYAAPDESGQTPNYETYLGLLENDGTFTAERYQNTGQRPDSAKTDVVDTSDWVYVTLVHTASGTAIYINGKKKAEQESSIALTDILGEDSILQVGKANWGSGEYYKGWLNNFKIMGTAMTAEEIKAEAEEFLSNIVDPERVADVIAKINDIGTVEAAPGTRKKIEQARKLYDKLTSAEKALVTNADTLFDAEYLYEEMMEEIESIRAEFTFDDVETGFKSDGSVANPSAVPTITDDQERGRVLSLDGTGRVWLDVAKEDGTPLLTGVEELTISYYSKAGRTETNWAFYAAPNRNAQNLNREYYIGIMENDGKVTAERFLNGRQASAEAAYGAGWNHIVVVYSVDDTKVYVNGILTGTADNNGSLKQILGEDSVLQLGKANWGGGEYYQGLLDDFTICGYALSERQIQIKEGIIANPEAIRNKLKEAKAIEKGNYTDESYQALQEAIAAARDAYRTVTTEEEVTAAAEALQAAIDGLKEKEEETQDQPEKVLVEKLQISPEQKTLTVGERFTMGVTVIPETASNPEVMITSSDSKVAEVSGTTILAKEAGKAVITVAATDESGVKASIEVTVCQKAVTELKAAQQKTSKNVVVTFGEVSGAAVYYVYRSTNQSEAYTKIGSTKGTSFVDKKVKTSKTYYYKIVTGSEVSGCDSALSAEFAKVKVLALPTAKVKASGGRKVTVSWKKIKGAQGYVVYTSTKKNKGFKAAKTLKKAEAVKASFKAKKSVKKMYVKVRPYYIENGKKIYGPYSKTKMIKIKK